MELASPQWKFEVLLFAFIREDLAHYPLRIIYLTANICFKFWKHCIVCFRKIYAKQHELKQTYFLITKCSVKQFIHMSSNLALQGLSIINFSQ